MADAVNHPSHYTNGNIECVDAIASALTPEEFRGYLKGNILKYTWRERLKGGDESMAKAQWYLNRLLNSKPAPKPLSLDELYEEIERNNALVGGGK